MMKQAIGLMDQDASEDYIQQKIAGINSEIKKYKWNMPYFSTKRVSYM
ncbi:hypothetical protein ABE354_07970 [Brevibacillus laterosporus]